MTDAQMATVRLERHRFHGDWNYTIHPAAYTDDIEYLFPDSSLAEPHDPTRKG